MSARVSMLLKSCASPDMLPFSLCNKKRLAIRHMNRSLFPTTLSIPSYDREVGRAKDLSATPRTMYIWPCHVTEIVLRLSFILKIFVIINALFS